MKKILAFMLAIILAVSVFSFASFAEETKTNDSTIDGVIGRGEYASSVEMKPDNVQTWTAGTLTTSATYYFRARRDIVKDDTFHIAIVTPKASFQDGYNFQINIGEGLATTSTGLFISFILTSNSVTILQHNHKTKLMENDSAQGADITELVTDKIVKDDGTNIVFEAALPNSLFLICDTENTATTFIYPSQMRIGLFAVIGGHGYTTLPNAPGADWTIGGLGVDKSLVSVFSNVSSKNKRDFDTSVDSMSYDQIIINGSGVANGNDQVIATKNLIDGTEQSINTISMFGWFGSKEGAVVSYGYRIDSEDIVWGDFKTTTGQDIIDAGGDSRYMITVPVNDLSAGKHYVRAVALLDNGTTVYLNRNAGGKDRAAVFIYNAPQVSRDQLQVEGKDVGLIGGNPYTSFISLDGANGKDLRIWGWYASNADIASFGYKIDGGDYTSNASFSVAADQAVINAAKSIVGENANSSRYQIYAPLTTGTHVIEACVSDGTTAKTIWTVVVAVDTVINPFIGESWGIDPFTNSCWLGHQENPTTTTVELTTSTAFKGVFFWGGYWASNTANQVPACELKVTAIADDKTEYTGTAAFDGDWDSSKSAQINFTEEVPAGHYTIKFENLNAADGSYFVFHEVTGFDPNKFTFDRTPFAFGLIFSAPAYEYYLVNEAVEPDAPATSDASLVIFVLAAAAIALVILKKKAF